MTEQILRQSREAESALADALGSPLSTSPELSIPDPISGFLRSLETRGKSPRKRSTGGGPSYDGFDNSDESETSSLCSEKSFDYGRPRPSDLGAWLGSRDKLYSGSHQSTWDHP